MWFGLPTIDSPVTKPVRLEFCLRCAWLRLQMDLPVFDIEDGQAVINRAQAIEAVQVIFMDL